MKYKPEENQIKWGITAFLVIAAGVVLYFLISESPAIAKFLGKLLDILMPFVYGLVFAFLLCPIYNLCVRKGLVIFEKEGRHIKHSVAISKALATTVSLIFFFVIIGGFLWMIIPGLIDSLVNVAKMLPGAVDSFTSWLSDRAHNVPVLQKVLSGWVENFGSTITDFIQKKLLPEYQTIATSLSAGLVGVLSFLKNFFVGIIICVYFLNSKEFFAAQSKKLILATFKEKRAESILNGAVFTNKTFGGFVNGKLIDSLIIGIICFLVMSMFNWAYALLISCIVGVTNIIPFFGPFIGAIPSALLLLMVDPMQCLYFIIFIIILQQVDGNILGPKILGDSTGLSSFWVMFAILVGGGLFGFVGMILGIPVFAVIYTYFSKGVNKKLNKKGFSVDLRDYKVDQYRGPKRNKSAEITIDDGKISTKD